LKPLQTNNTRLQRRNLFPGYFSKK
jgi:hypothetical protein